MIVSNSSVFDINEGIIDSPFQFNINHIFYINCLMLMIINYTDYQLKCAERHFEKQLVLQDSFDRKKSNRIVKKYVSIINH